MARKYNIENLIGNLSDKENFVEPEKVPNLYPDDTRVDISGDAKEQSILDIDIRCLKDNPNNHFAPLSEEAWEEFKGSIKEMGILTPLIVRKAEQEGFYEILAGHNRKNAAKEIGFTKLPCIVVEADDVEASVIVGVTNKQRENTTEIEWAWCYRTTYEAMKKGVGRPSKINVPTVGTLNSDDEDKCTHHGNILNNNKRTIDIVAEKYGVGKNTIARKIRLAYLVPQLANLYLSKKINQQQAIELSYLKDILQYNVVMAITEKNCTMTNELAKLLREEAENAEKEGRDFGISDIFRISKDDTLEKEVKRPKRYKVDESLFPVKLKKGMREQYIMKALEYIKEKGIEIEV